MRERAEMSHEDKGEGDCKSLWPRVSVFWQREVGNGLKIKSESEVWLCVVCLKGLTVKCELRCILWV